MMMLGLGPIDVSDKVYSITPSSMSTGVVTSLPGFTLGGDTLGVTNSTAYGVTGKTFGLNAGYLGGGDFSQPLFETKARGRDVVVTTWARLGQLYLRCDRATGRGIKITWTGQASDGELSVSYCTNIPDTFPEFWPGYGIGGVSLFSTTDVSSYVTGWDTADTTGDEFEFSLIANVLTVKWNSQTIYETDELWFAMNSGTVLFNGIIAEGGIRDTEITFKANAATYTDDDNKFLDFRDWGWKELSTTGSMSAASTTLTVASAAGFAIGDPIYVATGGEAGAGLKNTVGVGGTWPADSAADVASLPDAATYRAANGGADCYIWVESEAAIYGNFVSGWAEWTDYVNADAIRARGLWHTTFRIPKGLRATITNISGNTLTLDTPSVAATTDAEVYYDCTPIIATLMPNTRFEYAGVNAVSGDGWNVRFPAGTFCLTGYHQFPYSTNWTFQGEGQEDTLLYAPKGSQSPTIVFNGEDFEVRHFKMKGWAGASYWSFDNITNGYPNVGYHGCVSGGTYKSGGLFEYIDFENTFGGVNSQTRFGSVIRHCNGLQTNGNLQQYATWFFQMSYNDSNSWIEDCTYTATELGTAFEIFQQSSGGMRRCTSVQGVTASNFSGADWLMDEMDISIDWNDTPTENGWIDTAAPAINVNTNIGEGGYNQEFNGGTIRNPTINIVKRTSDGYIYDAININGGAFNVHVEGTHTAKPGAGVITMSDYEPGDAGNGAVGIRIDTPECSVFGIRVIGIDSGSFANISAYGDGDDCIIEDCVAETIEIDGVDQLGTNGNITNAAYEAL